MHMLNSLTFRTADKHLRNYGAESDVMANQHEAMECRSCDAWLQLGIQAFEWLIRADQEFREALARDAEVEPSVDFDAAFEVLCKDWLKSADVAKQQISIHQTQCAVLDNLAEFEARYVEMKAIVGFLNRAGDQTLPEAMIVLQDQAIAENASSETAEFV